MNKKLEKKLRNTVSCDVFVKKIEQFMRLSGFTISILVDEKLMNFKIAYFCNEYVKYWICAMTSYRRETCDIEQ